MNKFWLVLTHEYLRHVFRKRFIFALLSFPLIGLLVVGVIAIEIISQTDTTPIGYVTAPQIFSTLVQPPEEDGSIFPRSEIVAYETEPDARTALDNQEIQAYFLFPEDYYATGQVTMVVNESAGGNVEDDFANLLQYNLSLALPSESAARIQEGTHLIIRSADGSKEMDSENFLVIIMPLLAGLLFIIAINTGGGYLLQAVVEEKENRTMEIIITSLSPSQLMAAKTIGNLGVGLTQLVVWLGFSALVMPLIENFLPVGLNLSIDPSMLLLLVVTLLPAFLLVGALMAAVGAASAETREAQQIAGLFTLPIFIPYWFITPLMFNPNSPISIGLSMFPLTAPVALPLRAAFTPIPFWQTALTVFLLTVCALAALWLAGRVFRVGMLQYGKKINLKDILNRSVT
jgi:ABC-2 type transport system permease protein